MANLRVDKITSTETFEKTGSVQFDGSSDYLSLAVSSDFQIWFWKILLLNVGHWHLMKEHDDILGIYNFGI